jgi:hypothetical protein
MFHIASPHIFLLTIFCWKANITNGYLYYIITIGYCQLQIANSLCRLYIDYLNIRAQQEKKYFLRIRLPKQNKKLQVLVFTRLAISKCAKISIPF